MPDIDVTQYKKFTYRGGSFFTDASLQISDSTGLTYEPRDVNGFVHWLAGDKNMSLQEIVKLIEDKPPKELVDEYRNTTRNVYLKESDKYTSQEKEKMRITKIRAFDKVRDYKIPNVDLTDPRQMKKVALEMEIVYGILYCVDVGLKIGDKYSHAVYDAYREVYEAIDEGYEIAVRKQKHEKKDIIRDIEPKIGNRCILTNLGGQDPFTACCLLRKRRRNVAWGYFDSDTNLRDIAIQETRDEKGYLVVKESSIPRILDYLQHGSKSELGRDLEKNSPELRRTKATEKEMTDLKKELGLGGPENEKSEKELEQERNKAMLGLNMPQKRRRRRGEEEEPAEEEKAAGEKEKKEEEKVQKKAPKMAEEKIVSLKHEKKKVGEWKDKGTESISEEDEALENDEVKPVKEEAGDVSEKEFKEVKEQAPVPPVNSEAKQEESKPEIEEPKAEDGKKEEEDPKPEIEEPKSEDDKKEEENPKPEIEEPEYEIKEGPKLSKTEERRFANSYWRQIKEAKKRTGKRRNYKFELLESVLEEGEEALKDNKIGEDEAYQSKEQNIDPNAKVDSLRLHAKLSSFVPSFRESRRLKSSPEVLLKKNEDMGIRKDTPKERDEKIRRAKAGYKRVSEELPRGYESYKTLHTGYYVLGEPKDKLIDSLSKVLAAERLQRTNKPFSEKAIHKLADGMKKHLGIERLTEGELEDILYSPESVVKFAAKREQAMYAVPKDRRERYVDDMKLLWASVNHTMKMDPKGITPEFRRFAEEVHKASQLDPKTAKGAVFMLTNIRIMNSSEDYLKGRKQIRAGEYRNERFNSTLDAQAMILRNTNPGKNIFEKALRDRIRITTDRINEVRGTTNLSIDCYGVRRIRCKYGTALVSGRLESKEAKNSASKKPAVVKKSPGHKLS